MPKGIDNLLALWYGENENPFTCTEGGAPMGITSQKIAELAGVSRGTVDRALNHRGGVKPQVQRRIEELARQHGYSPNRAGKALVTREPLRVEVLLNSLGNPFYDEVKQGLADAREDYSDFPIDVHIRESKGYDVAAQLAQIEEAAASHPAGLILTPLNHPAVAERLGRLIDGGCPVVALNSDIDGCARLAYVGCHYARSGRTAAQLLGLITRGTGRLLVVTGSLKVMGHNQRVYGFSRVLAAEFPGMVIEDVVENNDLFLRGGVPGAGRPPRHRFAVFLRRRGGRRRARRSRERAENHRDLRSHAGNPPAARGGGRAGHRRPAALPAGRRRHENPVGPLAVPNGARRSLPVHGGRNQGEIQPVNSPSCFLPQNVHVHE